MPELYVQSSPHISGPVRTPLIMAHVLIALAPASIFGAVIFGAPALGVILVSVAAAVAGEALFRLVTRQPNRTGDLSAAVTGLLLALVLPPGTPLWVTALGAVFAVVVAKEFFGGIGANVFNPALSGRAFLLMSFPQAFKNWAVPGRAWGGMVNALSGASALGAANPDALTGPTPLGITGMGGGVSGVAKNLFELGLSADASYGAMIKTLFIGNRGGSIGETSILLILAGGAYLLAVKVLDWRAPLAMIASAFVMSFILGVDPLFSVLAGGLVFGAVFMASDYTTAPLTAKGKVIFGIGAGIIAMLIRKFGNYPEGVCYSILIMNAATPFLNRLLQKKYGYVKPKKPAAAVPVQGGAQSGTRNVERISGNTSNTARPPENVSQTVKASGGAK